MIRNTTCCATPGEVFPCFTTVSWDTERGRQNDVVSAVVESSCKVQNQDGHQMSLAPKIGLHPDKLKQKPMTCYLSLYECNLKLLRFISPPIPEIRSSLFVWLDKVSTRTIGGQWLEASLGPSSSRDWTDNGRQLWIIFAPHWIGAKSRKWSSFDDGRGYRTTRLWLFP